MKKKLMLISPMLHQGGFERVCITTARLMEPYFDVTIVIFNSANIAYDVTGLHIIDIRMGVQKGKLQKLFNIFRRSKRVEQLKKEWKPDIAYSFGPSANMVNTFSKTRATRGTRVWLGLRNYTDITETVKMKLFVRKADRILCCAKAIEEELQRKYHFMKTTTLYNLYDVTQIRQDADKRVPQMPWEEETGTKIAEAGKRKQRYLISMGREDDQKCFWHMLKIFAEVKKQIIKRNQGAEETKQIPGVRLIILGAGGYEKYKKLAAQLGILDDVYFAGMQKEPYIYLKQCDIYLLTSRNEGFPNALVEGMSLGLAAVSTDCRTGPSEILTDTYHRGIFEELQQKGEKPVLWGEYGVLVPDMDPEPNLDASVLTAEEKNMAEVIMVLLSEEEILRNYQEAAVSRAQIFTYEHYVERFLALSSHDL